MPKKTKIHLAKNLSFNTDVITEVIDIIAKRGSGKTYTATKLAEEMLGVGAQVVVVDPVGNWYGLRLGSDGKPKGGLDIKILGGRHGDIPLEYTAGKVVAKTVVESEMSVILDLSMLSKMKQRRFVTDFAESLLEYRKQYPAAMHVFWEEAQRFMPQKQTKGSKNEMLEATEELVTMGRNFGIGGTIVSQRSALVSKNVLTQAGILVAMHTNATADRKNIEAWMEYNKLEDTKMELAKLKKGEAYVWWPEEFGIKRIQVSRKHTYNASATPKFGQKQRRRKLRDVDMDALSQAMAETVEKIKDNDPRLLKRRIAELEKQLAAKKVETKTVEIQVLDKELLDRAAMLVSKMESDSVQTLEYVRDVFDRVAGVINSARSAHNIGRLTVARGPTNGVKKNIVTKKQAKDWKDNWGVVKHTVIKGDVKLTGGAVRMLKALAAMYPGGLTKKQVAAAAGMKSTSGTYSNYWSKLNVADYIESPGAADKGRWFITQAGLDYLGDDMPVQPDTPEEKLEFWCPKFPGRVQELLRYLFNHPDETFTKAELGDAVGLVPTSGTFSNYLSKLTSNNLAVKVSGGYQISPDLMV